MELLYKIYNMTKNKTIKLSKINNVSETFQIFECSSRSLMRWVKKFQTSQSIERKG